MKKSLHVEKSKQKKDDPYTEEKNDKLFHLSAPVGRGGTSTTAGDHHIAWINVYSLPSSDRMPRVIGTFECTTYRAAVGESNPDKLNTFPEVLCFIFPENPNTLHTAAYCAARGLWGSGEDRQ
jgi:desulfoferrodoxin (superoxide reductase-like protein)